MIRLVIAPEPAEFTSKVREPGENALALLAGKPLPHKRDGRPISVTKTVAGKQVPKTVADFPYWQDCLAELHAAYRGICGYYAFRDERASNPHVDHFIAKHKPGQDQVYEWSNYRLACGYANTCKHKHPDVLDPASIEDGWFQIDVGTLAVHPDPALSGTLCEEVKATIERLKLSTGRALEVRQHAMEHFRSGRVNHKFLQMDHPFLAKELARQGICTNADLPALPPQITEAVEPELQAGK